GVDYWTVLRDELKERVAQGRSAYPGVEEKFRVLELYMAPAHYLKAYEWMQRDYGVNIVSEVLIYYEDFEMDPNKPLESLALRWFKGPLWNVLGGSAEAMMEIAVREAKEMKADGAIWWDQFSCRQAGAVKLVLDAVAERVGIPCARINCDITDPFYTTEEAMKKELLDFLEVLEIRKELVMLKS
ncbi:MAG: 2-hydroxyacyl-CoA dehydratase family protein, partial [Syntrophales bacterium]|nr:2-hydroxyacyl-CoA dehydratase family protein [Syntrophales bacterium]